MTTHRKRSFIRKMRQRLLHREINFEIHDRIFPHLESEKNYGYPFVTDEELDLKAHEIDVQALLSRIEGHIQNMPKAYSKSFRYIFNRDFYERLEMYEEVARRAIQPKTCDPRFVALPYEPCR